MLFHKLPMADHVDSRRLSVYYIVPPLLLWVHSVLCVCRLLSFQEYAYYSIVLQYFCAQ